MGTSNIFLGPTTKSPLLPDEYEPSDTSNITDEQQSQEIVEQNDTWKITKTLMSKYLTHDGKYSTARDILKRYVKTVGGTNGMISKSKSGIRAAVGLGSLFSNIHQIGYELTFQRLGIEYQNKSIKEVFSRILDVLAPEAVTKEDIAARKAMQESLVKIYEYVEENLFNLESLNHLPIELVDISIKTFLTEYIWIHIMKDLESRVESYMSDNNLALVREQELKDVINAIVDDKYEHKKDHDIKKSISEIYKICIKTLEGIT